MIMIFAGCRPDKVYDLMNFANSTEICDNKGNPVDSTSYYFPSELFIDSINGKIDNLSPLEWESFILFKMKEPILYNYYLGHETYRIIVDRSFHNPIIARIDKYEDSIIVHIKKLNRVVNYPFLTFAKIPIKFGDSSIFTYKQQDSIIDRNGMRNDSLITKLNNTNYYNILDFSYKLKKTQWDSINIIIDSTQFWQSKPYIALNYPQIDGSRWTIEAQNKYGYQIIVIPNPDFGKQNSLKEQDKLNHYSDLFKYVFEISGLDNEKLY